MHEPITNLLTTLRCCFTLANFSLRYYKKICSFFMLFSANALSSASQQCGRTKKCSNMKLRGVGLQTRRELEGLDDLLVEFICWSAIGLIKMYVLFNVKQSQKRVLDILALDFAQQWVVSWHFQLSNNFTSYFTILPFQCASCQLDHSTTASFSLNSTLSFTRYMKTSLALCCIYCSASSITLITQKLQNCKNLPNSPPVLHPPLSHNTQFLAQPQYMNWH